MYYQFRSNLELADPDLLQPNLQTEVSWGDLTI
jgi:hypothetical protein